MKTIALAILLMAAPAAARDPHQVRAFRATHPCPATGRTIPTGIEADRLKFACSPVFFSDAYCPMCNANHRWFARDAWVEETQSEAVAEAA